MKRLVPPADSARNVLPAEAVQCEQYYVEQHFFEDSRSGFFCQITNGDLADLGIFEGDVLAVDTSMTPRQGSIVVDRTGECLTVQIFNSGYMHLVRPLPLAKGQKDARVRRLCGVAVSVIHRLPCLALAALITLTKQWAVNFQAPPF